MAKKRKSFEDILMDAQVGITNSLTKEFLKAPLQKYGYDESKLKQGLELHDTARALLEEHKLKTAEQKKAVDDLKAVRDKAHNVYIKNVKIARVALGGDKPALQKLDLFGLRKLPFAGWFGQTSQFYDVALSEPAILTKLAPFGITKDSLKQGKSLVDEAEAAHVEKEKLKAETMSVIRRRNKAFRELTAYMSSFLSIARLALEATPQLLESLMITVPSRIGRKRSKLKE